MFLFLFLSGLVAGGSIQIVTMPENASVHVNGEYYGQSPLNITIKQGWVLKPVNIQVNKEGYLPQNRSMFIPTTEYYSKIVFSLVPLNGTLYVNSNPLGAFVEVIGVDEAFNGTTPLEISLKPGNYTVRFTVIDDGGATATATIQISALANKPPIAHANAIPKMGKAPLTVRFYGEGTDPDGKIVSYHWEFPGLFFWNKYSDEQNPVRTYWRPGLYYAKLTVTDDDGATDTDTVTILVKPRIG